MVRLLYWREAITVFANRFASVVRLQRQHAGDLLNGKLRYAIGEPSLARV